MPKHPGTAPQMRVGWYRDPAGSAGQLRWWDGARWGTATPTPPPPRPPEPAPKRRRRVIGWAAIGAFSLGVSGVVIAVQRGQDVCEVSATGVKFCENDADAKQEVEQAQPALEQQASALQSQAQAQDSGETTPGLADVSGTWISDDGFTYVIEQFGTQAVLTEIGFGAMTTGTGIGFVDGPLYTFEFQAADGTFGTGALELEGNTLSGSFDNAVTGTSSPAVLRR